MKRFYSVFLFLIFVFSFYWFLFFLTDNFSVKDIVVPPVFHQSENIIENNEMYKNILTQPFYYFAKGHHAFAFISKDKKYILKFLRAKKLQRPFLFSFANSRRKQKEHINGKRLSFILKSHVLADKSLKEETAVVYSHFFKTQDLLQMIHINDKLKRSFFINADENSFILQKKVVLYEEILPKIIQKKDINSVKQMITSYFQVIANRCKKGVMNKDRGGWGRNYGFIEGFIDRAYEIDIGSYIVSDFVKTKEGMKKEIKDCSRDFRKYIEDNVPQVLDFFDEKIEKTVESNYQPLR